MDACALALQHMAQKSSLDLLRSKRLTTADCHKRFKSQLDGLMQDLSIGKHPARLVIQTQNADVGQRLPHTQVMCWGFSNHERFSGSRGQSAGLTDYVAGIAGSVFALRCKQVGQLRGELPDGFSRCD